MKILLVLLLCAMVSMCFGQKIISGEYSSGLTLAFNPQTKQLTGYYENHTGWDEQTKTATFSCIYYIEGLFQDSVCKITTYHPAYKSDGTIQGILKIKNDSTITIKLSEEHGGCWNVQSFTSEPVTFTANKRMNYIQLRYVTAEKTFFHSEKSADKKLKAYLIKNDYAYVEKIEAEWAYCAFHGKKITKGWIRLADLNTL